MNYKNSKLLIVLLFGIAMGFLESVVVVYLRQIYYSRGFRTHLVIPSNVIHIEMFREIMTIIMIWAVSSLAGENRSRKIYYFIYLFGIWDIFYYIGLKLILNWPPSILTWDILFLVPTEWLGPVLAPVIVSLTFIAYGLIMIFKKENLDPVQLLTGLGGGILIFTSFVTADANKLNYNWYIFSVGEGLILISMIAKFVKKISNSKKKDKNCD